MWPVPGAPTRTTEAPPNRTSLGGGRRALAAAVAARFGGSGTGYQDSRGPPRTRTLVAIPLRPQRRPSLKDTWCMAVGRRGGPVVGPRLLHPRTNQIPGCGAEDEG